MPVHWKRLAMFGFLGLAGCATEPVSLTDAGRIRVETVSSDAARVWWVDVLESRRGIQVTGEVIRRADWPADRPGHVDIEVRLPEGGMYRMQNVDMEPVITPGGGSRRLAFRVDLAVQPSMVGSVWVIHHARGADHPRAV